MKNIFYIIFLLSVNICKSQSWIQLGQDIDGVVAGDYIGYSTSINANGTIVAVGGIGNGANGSNSGMVKVYEYTFGSWVQLGGTINGEAVDDNSGWSISISDDGYTVVIGAIRNAGSGSGSGNARVFRYTSGAWTQVGSGINGSGYNDLFGWSTSISADGSIVAIGGRRNNGNGNDAGHVRIYQEVSGSWVQMGSDIVGEAAGDEAGYSVSLSADGLTVLVGASSNDGGGSNAGHARVFKYMSGVWTQVGGNMDGEASSDFSGSAVSMSEDGLVVAVGAQYNAGNGSNAGHVRVYEYVSSTNSWVQMGADIDGEAASDYSGESLSLSADGLTLAIGAPGNDGNGSYSGHVRVYEYVSNAWVQVGVDINGEASGDASGESVSISSDGLRVAIGAYENTVNGSYSGHVRVFKYGFPCSPTSSVVSINACGKYTTQSGKIWDSTGVYHDTIMNVAGCDSFMMINLFISNLSGDVDCNGVINNGEIAGDENGNGIIDNGEIAGDVNGNGVIDEGEIVGDVNGNGIIDNGEIEGDADGDGIYKSIFEKEKEVSITIYPNPFEETFVLQINNLNSSSMQGTKQSDHTLTIYTILGTKVHQENIDYRKETRVDVSSLSKGIYIVEVEGMGRVKVVKE